MITAWLVVVISLTCLYVFMVFFCLRGFYKSSPPGSVSFHPTVTVVVAFRNERNNLPRLIQSLQQQTYSSFDILLVNDHSTDLHNYVFPPGVTVITNQGEGKKQAIITGCGHTKSDIVVFTDADCVQAPHWLQSMVIPLQQPTTGLVTGGVSPAHFRSVFAFDDLALSSISVGATAAGFPFMCSGASMACRRQQFLEWQPYKTNLTQQSGDDVFLLQACIKNNLRVHAVTHNALVYHPPATSFKAFFSQRMRWGQKTGLQSLPALWVALTVFLYSCLLYAGLVMCFINLKATLICLIALIIGAIVNFLFLFLVSLHWKLAPSWALFVPAYLFHLGYIPWAALLGKIIPVRWKGRRVKSCN